MTLVAYIILCYLSLRVVVSLVNYASQPYLIKRIPEDEPLVSVLIPARNEELSLSNLMEHLQNQNYPNLEIIVYDDLSEDQTAAIVEKYSRYDNRIQLIKGKALPPSWLGKNYACDQLATHAKGDYFLFLDADVEPNTQLISKAIAYMQKEKPDLLSIFPHQVLSGMGATLVTPLMMTILLTLLPLPLIRKSKRKAFSAANGQFMLFTKQVYLKHRPHWWFKNQTVEDMSIMKWFKKMHIPCHTLLGGNDISCKMYPCGKDSITGFSKNIIRFFGNSIPFALFHLLCTTLGLLVMVLMPDLRFLSSYVIGVLLYTSVIGRMSNEALLKSWILIIPRQMALFIVMLNALKYRINQNYLWKGRVVKV